MLLPSPTIGVYQIFWQNFAVYELLCMCPGISQNQYIVVKIDKHTIYSVNVLANCKLDNPYTCVANFPDFS